MLETLKYRLRLLNEQRFYNDVEQVHDLPAIFHYWSNRYVRPMFEQQGFSNPDAFFVHECKKLARQHGTLRILSIGCGNGELEVELAAQLTGEGFSLQLDALDINTAMLERARKAAEQAGVEAHIEFTPGDFNQLSLPAEHYDAVLANQCLHHVLELEHLFDQIHHALKPHGRLLTSDIIGRNGHMRWPEALEEMEPFWQELPRHYRYNLLLKRQEDRFINHDCSQSGFEGIRAQDILPLLTERFQFELFLPFGNIIFPFVDRAFGHHFDAEAEWDRQFIDRVQAHDQDCILRGRLKPCSMVASLCRRDGPEVQTRLAHPKLSPQFCIRNPDEAPR